MELGLLNKALITNFLFRIKERLNIVIRLKVFVYNILNIKINLIFFTFKSVP